MQRLDRPPQRVAAQAPLQPQSKVEVAGLPVEQVSSKANQLMFLSCTVYDNQISVVHWSMEGRQYRAYVNVDFNDLAGIGSFESVDIEYSLFLGLGNDSSESLSQLNADLQSAGYPASSLVQLPALTSFPSGHSSYVLTNEVRDPAHVDADCEAIEALLAYYDANKLQLQQARQQREVQRLEREEFLKNNPPQPKDTVIQFWPIESQRYQVLPQEGAR